MSDSNNPNNPKLPVGTPGPQPATKKGTVSDPNNSAQESPKITTSNEKKKEKPPRNSLLMKWFGERYGFLITLFLVGAALLFVSTFFPENNISASGSPNNVATENVASSHADVVNVAFYYGFIQSLQSSKEILSNTVRLILQALGGTCLAATALYYLTTFQPLQEQINNYFIAAFTNRDYLQLVQDHHKQDMAHRIIRDLYGNKLPQKYLEDYIQELNTAAKMAVCPKIVIKLEWQRLPDRKFLQSVHYSLHFENYSSGPRAFIDILKDALYVNFIHVHKDDYITLKKLILCLPSQAERENQILTFDDTALKPLLSIHPNPNVVKHEIVSWDKLNSPLIQRLELLPGEIFTCDAAYTRTCVGFDPFYTLRFRNTCAHATLVATLVGDLIEEYDMDVDLFGDGIAGTEINAMPEKDLATGKVIGKSIHWVKWLSPGSGFAAVLVEKQPFQTTSPEATSSPQTT